MCNDPFSIKQEPEKVIWWNKYIRGKQLTGVLRAVSGYWILIIYLKSKI